MVLPVTILLAMVAVVGALVIRDRADQVAEADRMAAEYQAAVATFRKELRGGVLAAIDDEDPAAAVKLVTAAIDDPPRLAVARDHGRQASVAYRDAVAMTETLLEPYETLRQVLEKATAAQRFVKAADEALALRITDLIGTGPLTSGEPVRTRVIPAFENALRTFEAAPVPDGQTELAATVSGTLRYVIDQSRTLVARASAGQSYSFEYTDQLNEALEAVRLYEYAIEGEVKVALDAAMP